MEERPMNIPAQTCVVTLPPVGSFIERHDADLTKECTSRYFEILVAYLKTDTAQNVHV